MGARRLHIPANGRGNELGDCQVIQVRDENLVEVFQCMIHLAVYGTGLLVFGLNKKEREVLIEPAKKLIKLFGFTSGENAPNIL